MHSAWTSLANLNNFSAGGVEPTLINGRSIRPANLATEKFNFKPYLSIDPS